jgi:hypothetical protein
MKRWVAWVLLLLLAGALRADAAVVEGVDFPQSFSAEGRLLDLNGVGLMRWKYLIKGYVAALYLGSGATPDETLQDVPKRIEIEYFHGIDAEDFSKVTLDRIRLNVSEEEFMALRARIEQLNRLYRDVSPGDRYALTYLPGSGTELALNGRPLGRVPGADLARALFAIWLGAVPVDASLKQSLLGR